MKEGLFRVARSMDLVAPTSRSRPVRQDFSAPNFSGLARIVGYQAGAQKEARCPLCNSIVYSRRHKRCGVCGEDLPESCLFSFAQAKNVEYALEEERQRHRVWLRKANQLTC